MLRPGLSLGSLVSLISDQCYSICIIIIIIIIIIIRILKNPLSIQNELGTWSLVISNLKIDSYVISRCENVKVKETSR